MFQAFVRCVNALGRALRIESNHMTMWRGDKLLLLTNLCVAESKSDF
jgi:hypothetical protein